jgi:hypothetical protein
LASAFAEAMARQVLAFGARVRVKQIAVSPFAVSPSRCPILEFPPVPGDLGFSGDLGVSGDDGVSGDMTAFLLYICVQPREELKPFLCFFDGVVVTDVVGCSAVVHGMRVCVGAGVRVSVGVGVSVSVR